MLILAWGARRLCPLRGLRDDPPPCPPRALRARPRRRRTIAGGHGEAEREGASVASGCGGEGAGQVPKSPKGEASGEAVAGGGRRAERTLPEFPWGFPCEQPQHPPLRRLKLLASVEPCCPACRSRSGLRSWRSFPRSRSLAARPRTGAINTSARTQEPTMRSPMQPSFPAKQMQTPARTTPRTTPDCRLCPLTHPCRSPARPPIPSVGLEG